MNRSTLRNRLLSGLMLAVLFGVGGCAHTSGQNMSDEGMHSAPAHDAAGPQNNEDPDGLAPMAPTQNTQSTGQTPDAVE